MAGARAVLLSGDSADRAAAVDKILYATFVPHIEFTFAFLFIITGVFGTSISPYMFFWQASEEVEEEIAQGIATDKDGSPGFRAPSFATCGWTPPVGMVAAEAGPMVHHHHHGAGAVQPMA